MHHVDGGWPKANRLPLWCNYGHNNHAIKATLADYLTSDAVIRGLDLATPAKREYMETSSAMMT